MANTKVNTARENTIEAIHDALDNLASVDMRTVPTHLRSDFRTGRDYLVTVLKHMEQK